MLSRVACALARRAPKGARGMGGSAGPADAGRAVTYEGVTVQDADPTMKTIAVILGTTMWCVTARGRAEHASKDCWQCALLGLTCGHRTGHTRKCAREAPRSGQLPVI